MSNRTTRFADRLAELLAENERLREENAKLWAMLEASDRAFFSDDIDQAEARHAIRDALAEREGNDDRT